MEIGFDFTGQFNFVNLFTTSIILIAIYFLLLLAGKLLPLMTNRGNFGLRLQDWVQRLIFIFEPVTLVLIVGYFVLINPWLHGIIIGLILLLGFSHWQNYFNGRIIQFTNKLMVGQKIKVNDQTGIITKMDRLGLSLKTSKGVQALGYSTLFKEGYMIMSGEDIGGYYYLTISPAEGKEIKNFKEGVIDFLATVPYLDHSHALSFQNVTDDAAGVKTTVIVKEESHLNELIAVVKENGYACKISKK